MTTLLKLENLNVSFKTPRGLLKAVRDVTVELQAGESLGIVGESGSGKTTTLKMLSGLIYPTSGTARVLLRSASDTTLRECVGVAPNLRDVRPLDPRCDEQTQGNRGDNLSLNENIVVKDKRVNGG